MRRLSALLALTLTACAASHIAPADTAARDASIVDAALHDPVDSGVDAGAPECVDDAVPEARPGGATVRFRVRGAGWMVRNGFFCSGYDIVDLASGARLRLGIGPQCICECPAPAPPSPETLARLGHEPVDVLWDGRAVETYSRCHDCAAYGWLGGWVSETLGVRQPAAPGRYRARLVVYDTLPAQCGADGDTAYCMPAFGPPTFPSPTAGYETCPEGRLVEVELDLPESGEIIVDVDAR